MHRLAIVAALTTVAITAVGCGHKPASRLVLSTNSPEPTAPAPSPGLSNCPGRPFGKSSPAVFDPASGVYAAESLALVGERQLRFDVVQWLSGKDADEAYFRETGDDSGAPNDYYVANQSSDLRTAPVTADAEILVLSEPGFADSLHSVPLDAIPASGVDGTFWLTLKGGEITAICQQYKP